MYGLSPHTLAKVLEPAWNVCWFLTFELCRACRYNRELSSPPRWDNATRQGRLWTADIRLLCTSQRGKGLVRFIPCIFWIRLTHFYSWKNWHCYSKPQQMSDASACELVRRWQCPFWCCGELEVKPKIHKSTLLQKDTGDELLLAIAQS